MRSLWVMLTAPLLFTSAVGMWWVLVWQQPPEFTVDGNVIYPVRFWRT